MQQAQKTETNAATLRTYTHRQTSSRHVPRKPRIVMQLRMLRPFTARAAHRLKRDINFKQSSELRPMAMATKALSDSRAKRLDNIVQAFCQSSESCHLNKTLPARSAAGKTRTQNNGVRSTHTSQHIPKHSQSSFPNGKCTRPPRAANTSKNEERHPHQLWDTMRRSCTFHTKRTEQSNITRISAQSQTL